MYIIHRTGFKTGFSACQESMTLDDVKALVNKEAAEIKRDAEWVYSEEVGSDMQGVRKKLISFEARLRGNRFIQIWTVTPAGEMTDAELAWKNLYFADLLKEASEVYAVDESQIMGLIHSAKTLLETAIGNN